MPPQKKSPRKKPTRKKTCSRKKTGTKASSTSGTTKTTKVRKRLPSPDENERAQIWVLCDEGCTQRQIARQIGRNLRTVQRVLAEDPARYDAIRHAKAEERATLWGRHEATSLEHLGEYMAAIHRGFFRSDGKRRALTKDQRHSLGLLIRVLSPMKHIAEAATVKHELLTGQATNREGLPSAGYGDGSEMTDEQYIAMALETKLVDRMPARLREKAVRMHHAGHIELRAADLKSLTAQLPTAKKRKN